MATWLSVLTQTIQNHLHWNRLYAHRMMVYVPLTFPHYRIREIRLKNSNWGPTQWSQILFSSKSKFNLQCDNCWILIRKEHGTRNNPTFVQEISHYGRGGVLLWTEKNIGGRTDLYVIWNGSWKAQWYRDKILRPFVMLYAAAISNLSLLMYDNAWPHRVGLMKQFLEEETIDHIEWPAYFLDLNPIEHAWDALGKRIATRSPPPLTLLELESAIIEVWECIF